MKHQKIKNRKPQSSIINFVSKLRKINRNKNKYKWKQWLKKWGMTSLKIKAPFLEMDFNPSDPDRKAAWELYIELVTRVTTQKTYSNESDQLTALKSIYSLFPITRTIIKENGKECIEFTKLAVIVLNQKIRPFTAKWHKISIDCGFEDNAKKEIFYKELTELQDILKIYSKMLADMAGVEDLTEMEK
ncbi:hypothetical protein [Desulfoluna spongiiphila]|uniref:Uncharacterized protein n=1 Tax=Desulfoluna spongiiphila TaxID=419481 RepID=A0A1G5JBX4_9BACT|nr:hypothetical protein [Desulfoluna spongiiphila]SCY85228.1 hypothetical protein SAMN05216233_1273 [Desulfoluna spongiiphila]